MTDWRETVAAYLTPPLREALLSAPAADASSASELRICAGRPASLCAGPRRAALGKAAPAACDVRAMADAMLGHAASARQEELRQGFVTLPGGHRAGLCGRTVVKDGRVAAVTDIASIVVRVAREVQGCAEALLPYLLDRGLPQSALIVSPPGLGKTTMLRDAARLLSRLGFPVTVVDERGEIAACARGVPTLDVGGCTDVLDGCPKAEGMLLSIRAFAPRVIVTDEIGRPEDADAALDAARCGVAVVASAHGRDYQDIIGRRAMRAMMESGVFTRVVALSGVGQIGAAFDGKGERLG